MDKHKLEQIFYESKFPELTFVPLKDYPYIKSAIRMAGKHFTISGPSGSDKTTAFIVVIAEAFDSGCFINEKLKSSL